MTFRFTSPILFLCYCPPPFFSSLSLHDALPISLRRLARPQVRPPHRMLRHRRRAQRLDRPRRRRPPPRRAGDRKSTRLNSSHLVISYAVFCLKKKNNTYNIRSLVNTITRFNPRL